jgi:YHS domain-containing protein
MRMLIRAMVVAFGVLALSGCAPLMTQSPGGALSPVNAVADGEDTRVMLAGADVVAYFTENKHRQGDPSIKSVIEGVTFRFATAGHKALFDNDPERYKPQYGGY